MKIENNQEKQNAIVSLGGAGQAEIVELEFADGLRAVPAYIVAHLGGRDALSARAEQFKNLSYDDFCSAFHNMVSADTLNRIQSSFVTSFLRRR
ncbi:MAG TPA: hypothetical protein VF648_00545 [Pyrinomonadaceae bacterium]|jgi:hypothetical protein